MFLFQFHNMFLTIFILCLFEFLLDCYSNSQNYIVLQFSSVILSLQFLNYTLFQLVFQYINYNSECFSKQCLYFNFQYQITILFSNLAFIYHNFNSIVAIFFPIFTFNIFFGVAILIAIFQFKLSLSNIPIY